MARQWLLIIVVMSGGLAALCAGENAPEKLRGWQKLFHDQAGEYAFSVVGRQSAPPIRLVSEPVLQWSQPIRGGQDGAVYVWTQAGRPVAIATFFIWPMANGKQGVSHELHSLSQDPLKAVWRDRTWTPPKNSLAWMPLESAPPPAATGELRLRQMREVAKMFRAESRDRSDRRWELRLLPRPLYRYELDEKEQPHEGSDVMDGALFGFLEGTDLEVVLALQARRDKSGSRWEFALARMSDFRLKAMLGERTVWEVKGSNYDQSQSAYYCSTVESRDSPEEKQPGGK